MRRAWTLPAGVARGIAAGFAGMAWCLATAGPLTAQEGAPPEDAAAPDTAEAPGDDPTVGPLPGPLVGVLADTATDSTFAVLADPLRPSPDRLPGPVILWDRERIRRSNAVHLGELLARMIPGTVPLRATYFGGPMHLVEGPLGPALIDLRIDGRPFAPLIGAQPDLSRILLAMVDEVRVERHATGLRVDVTTLRRTDRRAYSRIEAGSGDPGLESLRLVFTNGFGRAFAATAGFELLDASNPVTDLQGFSGGLAWLPGGGRSGLELQYEQRSFERTLAETRTGNTSRLVLGGHVELGDGLQLAAWVAEAVRELEASETEASMPASRASATHGGVEIRGVRDHGWVSLGGWSSDGEALPKFALEGRIGVHATDWLTVDAAGQLGSRDEFSTREGRVGLAIRLPLEGARLYGGVSSGMRGAVYPAIDSVGADSVEFEGVAGGAELDVGPLRLSGRLAHQRVERQVAFGTGFDEPGAMGAGAEVTSFEVGVDAPVLPLSWLLEGFDPVRVRGFYRHNRIESDATPLFVPINVLRGEVAFEDTFLEGDLGVRLAIGIDRRDPWSTPAGPGDLEDAPIAIPSRTSWDFDLGVRIVGVLLFWRYDNIDGRLQQDLPGFEFPVRRQVFGVRWSFYE